MGAYAQQPGQTIRGRVIDQNKQPVPYATIRLLGKGIGTAANESGEFALRLLTGAERDTLEISSIGYLAQKIPLPPNDGNELTVVLATNNLILKAVNVTYRDPMKIISKAVSRIADNYIQSPHVIRGFYRETTMKDKTPLEISEAVFDIFNYGYTDPRQDMFSLIKARDEKNDRDFHGIEVGQSPGGIFDDDIIKQLKSSDILDKDGIRRHNYEVAGITDYNGRPAYEITFSEKQGADEHTYRGKMLIDTASYAFAYFDYGMSPVAMKKYKFGNFNQRLMMKMAGLDVAMQNDRARISYQRVGGKWVLAGVTGNNTLQFKDSHLHYDFPAAIRFNYVVTQVDTTRQAPFTGVLRSGEHINDHDTNEGEEFWKDYNVMLPDRNTEALIREIRAINKSQQLKARFEAIEQKLPKDAVLRIDSMLSFYHAGGQFNGSALVSSHGKVLLSKSYGWADQEKKIRADEHTTYRIGSFSKSFTGIIINQLMAEGKIDVHAPVKTYLPWYIHGDVTIEQLLTHRSGIPDYLNSDEYKQQLFTHSFTLRDVVQEFCSDTLEFKSGSAFSYSNSNYAVLALVAQEVAGKPFGQLLQDRIFNPAGMKDTFLGAANGHPREAIGYTNGGRELSYDPANTAGAGGISSSTADILKFHDALRDNKLLSMAAADTMFKPRAEFKDYGAWYDYGWLTDKNYFSVSQKHTVNYNAGTDLGFLSMYLQMPDTDSCIILLNNTGDFPGYNMAEMILNILEKEGK